MPAVDWSTESSALRLTERHACQFFFEPLLFGAIGRMGQPIGELEECDLLPFLRIEAAFDQIDQDAVGAGAAAFRERLNTPCHSWRETDALADTSLRLCHGLHRTPSCTTMHQQSAC